eukprot:6500850-Pyramimonas_sp.AAC.1
MNKEEDLERRAREGGPRGLLLGESGQRPVCIGSSGQRTVPSRAKKADSGKTADETGLGIISYDDGAIPCAQRGQLQQVASLGARPDAINSDAGPTSCPAGGECEPDTISCSFGAYHFPDFTLENLPRSRADPSIANYLVLRPLEEREPPA